MGSHTECRNCRRLLGEIRTLRRDLTTAKSELAIAKSELDAAKQRIKALEAELRRGKRQATPFSRDRKMTRSAVHFPRQVVLVLHDALAMAKEKPDLTPGALVPLLSGNIPQESRKSNGFSAADLCGLPRQAAPAF